MNILAIAGSPRKNSNSTILMERTIEAVMREAHEVEIERANINDLRIEPCRGTHACRKTGRCVIDDDMVELIEKIKSVDGLIIASPIYRRYLPGQMKVFMDRLSPLEKDHRGMRPSAGMRLFNAVPIPLQEKIMRGMMSRMGSMFRLERAISSVIILTGGHPDGLSMTERDFIRTADELCFFSRVTGGKVAAVVKAGGLMAAGEVSARPALFEAAAKAGQKLAKALSQ